MTFSQLSKSTRDAKKSERAKRARLLEKEKKFDSLKNEFEQNRIILDIESKSKKVLAEVEPAFTSLLKPHQVEGIKFLFNCSIESLERLNEEDKARRESCGGILAHCMGLGKTFQTIVFLSSILSNSAIKNRIRCVLIIVPLNVLQNWQVEFHKWFHFVGTERKFKLFQLNTASRQGKRKVNNYFKCASDQRAEQLNDWYQQGGVLLITPNLLCRLLSTNRAKKKSDDFNKKDIYYKLLLDPGPDMVIIDEGHCLKNSDTDLNKSVKNFL